MPVFVLKSGTLPTASPSFEKALHRLHRLRFERARLSGAPHWTPRELRALAPEVLGRDQVHDSPTNTDTLPISDRDFCEQDFAEYRSDADGNRAHRECGDRKIPSARFPGLKAGLSSLDTRSHP